MIWRVPLGRVFFCAAVGPLTSDSPPAPYDTVAKEYWVTLMMKLLDIARQCFIVVGPSRLAACSLTILDAPAFESESGMVRYAKARDRLKNAKKMLEHDFPQALKSSGYQLSAPLQQELEVALACISRLVRELDGPPEGFIDRMGGKAEFREYFFEEIEPAVTKFAERMVAELLEEHEARVQTKQSEALQAVRDADQVGRAISLIAVNAAIEAARSGDKGFKVIADEIKTLTSRTQSLLVTVGEAMRHY